MEAGIGEREASVSEALKNRTPSPPKEGFVIN